MAKTCTFTVSLPEGSKTFTEPEFKAWLATGGLNVMYPDGAMPGDTDVLFSRKTKPAAVPIDDALVAVHNLSYENLMYANELGGIPVPSIGVTKAATPFDGFGEISLIGTKDLVDPSANVPVFDRDGYTARFPELNYKAPKSKDADAFYFGLSDIRGMADDGNQFMAHVWDGIRGNSNPSPSKVAEAFTRYDAPKIKYIKEVLGKDIKIPMIPVPLRSPASNDKEVVAFLKKNKDALWLRDGVTQEQHDKAASELKDKVIRAIRSYVEKRNVDADAKEVLIARYTESVLDSRGEISPRTIMVLLADLDNIGKKQADGVKLNELIRKYVPYESKEYAAWAKAKIDGLFDAPTIKLGGKQVPATLDNIVASMIKGSVSGKEKTMTFGAGKAAAKLGKQFKSMDEIKAARAMVVSPEAEKAGKESATDSNIIASLRSSGFKSVDQETIDLAKASIDAMRSAATDYFEAKPQRAVSLDEFKGAVVPKGTPVGALDSLADAGVKTVFYDKSKPGDRDEKLKKLATNLNKESGDVLFSRTERTQKNYENRIDELFNGSNANRVGVTVLDRSDVLDMLGYGNKPVVLSERKVIDSQKNHEEMTSGIWKKVPEWIENPAAVFESDTDGGLVFIAPGLIGGRPVSVVVVPDSDGRNSLNVHLLLNAYSRSVKTPFARWISDGLLKYVDKRKFPAMFQTVAGRQLPGTAIQNKLGTRKILTENNLAGYRKNSDTAKFSIGDTRSGGAENSVYNPSSDPADISAVDALNKTLAGYFKDGKWENAYGAVELPDSMAGIGKAIEAGFSRSVRAVRPRGRSFDLFNGFKLSSRPNDIYVNADSDVGFVQVAGHELWHDIKKSSPELAAWFRDQMRPYLNGFDRYKDRLNNLRQEGEKEYSDSGALEELEADFVGDALADPKFLQGLADASPSKFTQLLNAVTKWLGQLSNRLRLKGLKSSQYVTDVDAVRKYLQDVLVAHAEGKAIDDVQGGPGGGLNFSRGDSQDQTQTEAFKRWFGDWELARPAKRSAATFDQAREAAKEFQGKDLTNLVSGIVARVSRNSLDKMLSSKAVGKSETPAAHSAAVANLDSLFESAVQGWSKPDSNGDPNIRAVHRFFAPLNAGGRVMLAKLTVKEMADGVTPNRLYSVESVEFNEKSPAAQWVAAAADSDGIDLTSTRSAGDVVSLAQRVENFNPLAVSKVVDAEGKPLVVYHGTRRKFDVFAPSSPRGAIGNQKGVYFTADKSVAEEYAQDADGAWDEKSQVIAAYIKIGNDADGKVIDSAYRGREYVVFKPENIKSAIGNNGEFNPENPSILFSRRSTDEAMDFTEDGRADTDSLIDMAKAGDVQGVKREGMDKLAQVVNTLNDTFHDAMGPAKRWIKALGVPDVAKRALLSGLYRGAVKRDALQHEAKSLFGDKILKGISQVAKKHGLDTETAQKLVGYWLTANYAPKANEWLLEKDRRALAEAEQSGDDGEIASAKKRLDDRIAAINDRAVKGVKRNIGVAGGLNNAQAALMKANIEKRIPEDEIKAIAENVYDLLEWKKNLDIESGKVTKEQVASWPGNREYVPLTGSPYVGLDEDVFGTGTTLPNVSKDKALDGRTESVADDGISAVWREISKTATHAGFQDFKRALNAVYEDTLQLKGGDRKATSEALGLSRTMSEGNAKTGDDVIIYRDKGGAHVFRFDDQNVMTAIKKGNTEKSTLVGEMVGAPTRLFSQLATLYNITFAPTNTLRDVWERSELVRTRGLFDTDGNKVDGDKIGRQMWANMARKDVWAATRRASFGEPDLNNPVDRMLHELAREGGISTWGAHFAKTRDNLANDIDATTSKLSKAKHYVEAYNSMFELVSGLSGYMAMREAGMDPKEAAYQSLDLMNFRKQGAAMGGIIKPLYAFSQPIVTGGANLASQLSTPKGRARFAAYVAVGAMLYAALRGMADDDEGGNKLDQAGAFVLDRSIPIPTPGGIVKIPVGFGLPQLAWSWATNIVKAIAGEQTVADAAQEVILRNAVKSFSPVQPSEISVSKDPMAAIAVALTPTVAKPFMQLAVDKTAFGAPISPKFYKQDVFKSKQGKDSTAQFYKDAAEAWREITGQDVFPEQAKVIIDGLAVGPLRTMLQVAVTNPNAERLGRDTNIPVVGAFYQAYNQFAVSQQFYAAVDEATVIRQKKNSGAELSDEEQKKLDWLDDWSRVARGFTNRKSSVTRMKLPEERAAEMKNAIAKDKESEYAKFLMRWRMLNGKTTKASE